MEVGDFVRTRLLGLLGLLLSPPFCNRWPSTMNICHNNLTYSVFTLTFKSPWTLGFIFGFGRIFCTYTFILNLRPSSWAGSGTALASTCPRMGTRTTLPMTWKSAMTFYEGRFISLATLWWDDTKKLQFHPWRCL